MLPVSVNKGYHMCVVVSVGPWCANIAATLLLSRDFTEWTGVDVSLSFLHVRICRTAVPCDSVRPDPRNGARNFWTYRRLYHYCCSCDSYLYWVQIAGGRYGSCSSSSWCHMMTWGNSVMMVTWKIIMNNRLHRVLAGIMLWPVFVRLFVC